MFLYLIVCLLGSCVVTGQVSLSVPAAGNCGDNAVLTCRYNFTTNCTSWGFFKDSSVLINSITPTTNKYKGSADSVRRLVYLTVTNMTLADVGNYFCNCGFTQSSPERLLFECKPTTYSMRITKTRLLQFTFGSVYPSLSNILVSVDSESQNGTYICNTMTSTSYSCVWSSFTSLEDVDGVYKVVVTTLTETIFNGSIMISTPGSPVITNREQLSDGRSCIYVTENIAVTLTCVSRGGSPAPTVAWYMGNTSTAPLVNTSAGILESDGTYNVTLSYTLAVSLDEDGMALVCRSHYPLATSPVTRGANETSVLLYIYVQPSHPNLTQVNDSVSGENVTLECNTSGGRPVPTITWTYRGLTFSPQGQSTLDPATETYSVVSILQRPVTAEDNGKLVTCQVTHPALTSESTESVVIDVKFPVSSNSTVITGNTQIEATGSNPLDLNCTTGSSNPASTITWRNKSTVIPNNNTVYNWTGENEGFVLSQILRQTPTRENDGDVITCSVTSSDSDVAVIQGDVNDSITFNLTYSPEIQPMTDITVDEGQIGVVLPCLVSSKPVSNITWYHDGSFLVQGEGTADDDGYNSLNYTLSRVSRYDEGTYSCQADNGPGTANSTDMNVTVRYVIMTTTNSSTDTLSITITCTLNNFGDSYESQLWVQEWPGYGEVNRRPFSPMLTLTQLTYEFSGVYTCSVKALANGAIYVQGNTSLLVKSPPVILEPKANRTGYQVAARLHNKVTFSVQFFSNIPGSDVKCYRNNNMGRRFSEVGTIAQSEVTVQLPVFNHTVPTLGTMATVTIRVQSKTDFGDYVIVITNGIGKGSFLLMTVVQQGPPSAPVSLGLLTTTIDTATVEWAPGYHGNMDQTFVIQVCQDGVTWSNKTSVYGGQDLNTPYRVTLDGLTPSTLYYVRLFAYNHDGRSEGYSHVMHFTTATSVTCNEDDNIGVLVGGMAGTLCLGFFLGFVVCCVVHYYWAPTKCCRSTEETDSTPLAGWKRGNGKSREASYQNSIMSSDDCTTESRPIRPHTATYEELKIVNSNVEYVPLQSTGTTESRPIRPHTATYEELKIVNSDVEYVPLQSTEKNDCTYHNLKI